MLVSVIIKTFNEEAKIARSIESALAAVARIGGEVILADSLSADRTVAIASTYPIKIVRLCNPMDRCCGVGAQLGFQYARGDFVYILDGDMQLHTDFLEAAVELMEQHNNIAGVGGRVIEKNVQNLEFQAREERMKRGNTEPGIVGWLSMGGLYRRVALTQVGFFTNPNLHAYEEFDLGVRLRCLGWELQRIPLDAVDHYGHTANAYTLLLRRWRSKYLMGTGEVLRGALGQRHFWAVIREFRALRLYVSVCFWWAALAVVWLIPAELGVRLIAFAGLFALPFFVMWAKKRSIEKGTYSVVLWNLASAGLLRGFCQKQRDPERYIHSELVHDSGSIS